MNAASAFFDTNLLLYLYGGADPRKRELARQLFQRHARAGQMLLSAQVVQEFYAAGSRKLKMPRRELREAVAALLELRLVVIGPPHILAAMDVEERHQISFWDALIVAAAESGGAEVLYTEDLNDRQQYGAVTVQNPFRSAETHPG
jgi:predicted nucleic acid-binding protein